MAIEIQFLLQTLKTSNFVKVFKCGYFDDINGKHHFTNIKFKKNNYL